MKKFIQKKTQKFIEENGRNYFIILKSIIKWTGNYYIEARNER